MHYELSLNSSALQDNMGRTSIVVSILTMNDARTKSNRNYYPASSLIADVCERGGSG